MLSTAQVKNQLHPESLQDLDKTHLECQEIKAFAKAFFREVTKSHFLSPINKGEILF